MSIDEYLNMYRGARDLLQEIIDRGVKTKEELIKELQDDLKDSNSWGGVI